MLQTHYISSSTGSGSATDFVHPMSIPLNHNRVALLSAQIPKMYYNVPALGNTYTWNGVTKTVPVGNYTAAQFANALTTATGNATWSFSSLTGKFSANTGASNIVIGFPAASRIDRLLGFGNTTTSYTLSTSGLNELPNMCNMSATSLVWICSSLVVGAGTPGAFGNILSEFYTNDYPDQSFVTFENPAPIQCAKMIQPTGVPPSPEARLRYARFAIFDDEQQPLVLNGTGVNMCLVTWEEKDYYQLHHNFYQAFMKLQQALHPDVLGYGVSLVK